MACRRAILLTLGIGLGLSAGPAAARSGFIENVGQWKTPATFVAFLPGATVHFAEGAVYLDQHGPAGGRSLARLRFDGAELERATGRDVQAGRYHFLFGADPFRWQRGVRSFARLEHVVVADGERLEISFWIEHDRLCFELVGPIGEGGDRVFPIRFESVFGPLADVDLREQEHSGGRTAPPADIISLRRDVVCSLGVGTGADVSATAGSTGLAWSTYLGGALTEEAGDVVVHEDGRVTVVGNTHSPDFPVTSGAFDPVFNPGTGVNARDAFVCQFTGAGALVYCTYLGGVESTGDWAQAVAASANDEIVVAGYTASESFPVTPGAFQPMKASVWDGFVSRLVADGSDLVYSTFLGGRASGVDLVEAVAVLPSGEVILAGRAPAGFPTTRGAFQASAPTTGYAYPFVTRLAANGDRLVYSTHVAGDDGGSVHDMSVAPDESVVIVGDGGLDFPTTPGAVMALPDAQPGRPFITRVAPDGSSLIFSGSLGGTKADRVTSVDHDPWGRVVLAGHTYSTDFPVTPDAFDLTGPTGSLDGQDGFVTVLDPFGTTIEYSSYLGASFNDLPHDVLVDGSGAIVVAGTTTGFDFPVTPGAFDEVHNPGQKTDLFVTRFSPDRRRVEYSTFVGGSENEINNGNDRVALAEVPTGGAVVVSDSVSPDYPVTEGALQTTLQGRDVVVSQLELLPTGASRYGRSTPGCTGPLVISVTEMPKVGAHDFAVTCTRAPPVSHAGFLVVSLAPLASSTVLLGAQVWVDPDRIARLVPLRSDRLGYAEAALPLGHDPGVPLFLQAFWRDPCALAGWSATAGLALDIQP